VLVRRVFFGSLTLFIRCLDASSLWSPIATVGVRIVSTFTMNQSGWCPFLPSGRTSCRQILFCSSPRGARSST
jgi:hypothetical protein